MAEWNANPTWTPLEQINGGQQFNPDDVLTPDDLNKLVENMQYLYEHGGNFEVNPYPIGAVIELYTNDSPAMLYGGDWTELPSGYFSITANGHTMAPTYNGELTGGSADAVVVSHFHSATMAGNVLYNINSSASQGNGWYINTTDANLAGGESSRIRTDTVGVDGTGKNMPPWIAVHKWRRIG